MMPEFRRLAPLRRDGLHAFASLPFITALMLLGGSPQLSAQTAAPTPATGGELEEVVVSAEKRESTVQRTPVSITAITGAELEARGITDLVSVAQSTPGISFKTAGPGQTEFEMRGLTSSGGFSPTVGFYVDDAPLTAPAQAFQGKVVIDPDLYDLNRVEVLRGPQGTLYGSGSMGGTIKLVTNKPVLNEFQSSAQAIGSRTTHGGGNGGANGMVNLPLLTDRAALRLVGTYRWDDGWIDRVVLSPFPLETPSGARGDILSAPVEMRARGVNWQRVVGGRAALLLQLGDRLTMTPSVLVQKISQGGPNTIDNPPGTVLAHFSPFDVREPFSDKFTLYTGTIAYAFDQSASIRLLRGGTAAKRRIRTSPNPCRSSSASRGTPSRMEGSAAVRLPRPMRQVSSVRRSASPQSVTRLSSGSSAVSTVTTIPTVVFIRFTTVS